MPSMGCGRGRLSVTDGGTCDRSRNGSDMCGREELTLAAELDPVSACVSVGAACARSQNHSETAHHSARGQLSLSHDNTDSKTPVTQYQNHSELLVTLFSN